jgi:hypothetical protein
MNPTPYVLCCAPITSHIYIYKSMFCFTEEREQVGAIGFIKVNYILLAFRYLILRINSSDFSLGASLQPIWGC